MPELSELSSLYVQRLEDLGIRKTIKEKTSLMKALLEHYNGVCKTKVIETLFLFLGRQ